VRILASEVAPIETVRERIAREVAIHLKGPADRNTFEQLGEIFSRHRGDRKVLLEIDLPAPRLRVRADLNAQIRVRPSQTLIAELERVVGQGAVELR
jgi:hypothetical protein